MDLILITMNKIKEFIDKLKNVFSFIFLNYLPEQDDTKKDFGFF